MHTELWDQIVGLDREKMAGRALCRYFCDRDCFGILFLGREYEVLVGERQIFCVSSESLSEEAGFLEQLCILAYLINSKELPAARRLVKAESLPGGQFFFRGQHGLPVKKLADIFGANPGLL